MTNTATQPETDRPTREPTIKELLKSKDPKHPDIMAIAQKGPDKGTITPAEIVTDKDMDPEEKKHRLLSEWGRKGGLKTAKTRTKWKDEFIEVAKKLAIIGVNEGGMAALFQVDSRTFRGWKRAHPALTLALKEGESLKRANLLQQMQASAFEGIFQMQIFLAKNWLGMTDRQDIRTKGEQTIIYKSHIPQEKGSPDVDQGSIKRKPKGIPGARTRNPQGKEAK